MTANNRSVSETLNECVQAGVIKTRMMVSLVASVRSGAIKPPLTSIRTQITVHCDKQNNPWFSYAHVEEGWILFASFFGNRLTSAMVKEKFVFEKEDCFHQFQYGCLYDPNHCFA